MDQTPTPIVDLPDEKLAVYYKKLRKRFAIQMAGMLVVTTAVVVGAAILEKKLDAQADDNQE